MKYIALLVNVMVFTLAEVGEAVCCIDDVIL